MAKVTGPLLSLAANGSIGRVINFRGNDAAPIVSLHRQKPSIITPASAANRLRAAHAASTWQSLDLSVVQRWTSRADSVGLPVFAYYLQQWQRQGASLSSPPLIPVI